MRKTTLYVVLLLLLFLNIYYIFNDRALISEIDKDKLTIQSSSERLAFFNKMLKYSYSLFIRKNDTVDYSSLPGKFALYVTEGNCGSCIEQSLLYLYQVSEKIGYKNTILLGNFEDQSKFDIYSENAKIFVENSLNIGKLDFDDLMNQPVFFIVDDKLKCNLVFIPDYQKDYMDEYFNTIIPNYFSICCRDQE